jgi:hypothetical protein
MELKNVEILHIGELKQITVTYKNVEFVVKSNEQYPQEICFQISNEKADKFIQYNKVGQFVDVDFNLRGRSYLKDGEPEEKRRWFNQLDAWKVFKSESDTNTNEPFKTIPAVALATDKPDDLPF